MKKGFTLSEVLITLGIIGIIAAMTLPSLIAKQQKLVMVTQLKKAYTELNEAVKLSEVDNGELKDWDYSITTKIFFNKYLSRYLKLGAQKVGDVSAQGITYYQISGTPETELRGMYDSSNIVDVLSGYQIFVAEGISSGGAKTRICLYIDVNGFKGPNTFGKDIHSFMITSDKGVIPFSVDDTKFDYDAMTRTKMKNGPSVNRYQCNSSGRGMWCTALIMIDGWEIKDDYPWK